MSALRERRVRIYGYEDGGTAGLVSARYVFREERWACVSQRSASKQVMATSTSTRVDATIDFATEVDVRKDDLLVDGTDRYFARGITLQRTPPAKLVGGERIEEEVFLQMVVVDPDDPDALDDVTYDESVVES